MYIEDVFRNRPNTSPSENADSIEYHYSGGT
jgi:hypothetical protein